MSAIISLLRWVFGFATKGSPALYEAVQSGDLGAIEALLDSAATGETRAELVNEGIKEFGQSQQTPLIAALRLGRRDIVRCLVRNGAHVLREGDAYAEVRALIFEAEPPHAGSPELLRLIIEANGGSSLGIYDVDDGLPFAFDEKWGEDRTTQLMDIMLENGGGCIRSHLSLTQNGETLLHLAAKSLFPSLCRRLLNEGLSPNAPSWGESTPLGAAIFAARFYFERHPNLRDAEAGHTSTPDEPQSDGSIETETETREQPSDIDANPLETIRVLLAGGGDILAKDMAGQDYIDEQRLTPEGALPEGANPQDFVDSDYTDTPCTSALMYNQECWWFPQVAALIDEFQGTAWRTTLRETD